MDYNGKTHSIKTEQLPRTWSEILSSFSVREIRKFPLEGQALTNARHAIPRMERRGPDIPHPFQRQAFLHSLYLGTQRIKTLPNRDPTIIR